MPDGCRLAVDLYLPECAGKVPGILHTGRGTRREHFEENKEFLLMLLEHGYAVILPDVRGFGASFGFTSGFHGRKEAQDFKCLMETMAQEDWCSGLFGMFGGSNCGFIQDLTVAELPAPLKAVIPCDCHPDFYFQNYPNGASRHIEFISGVQEFEEPLGDPVDEDTDGSLAALAQEDHKKNLPFLGQFFPNMRRDTVSPSVGYAPFMEDTLWHRMEPVKAQGIHYYKNGAWYDPGAAGAIFAFQVLDDKLLIGPWRHCEIYHSNKPDPTPEEVTPWNLPIGLPNAGFPWEDEYIRFFDAALKGVDTGCFSEPGMRYYTRDEEPGKEWKYAASLPLDDQQTTVFHLLAETSGTIDSCHDGSLSACGEYTSPDQDPVLSYTLNRDIQLFHLTGTLNKRLEDVFGPESRKCLTFTTAPFEQPVEITGIPQMDLSVTSNFGDGIFLVVLEEVYPDGTTCYLTDGAIRASHAHTGSHPAYDSLGLPYHPGMSDDLPTLDPQKPLKLCFIMDAFSQVIKKDSRLRLSVFCGEKMYQQPPCIGPDDAPVIGLHLKDSVLKLPVIAPHVSEFSGRIQVEEEAGEGIVYVFKRGIYVYLNDRWYRYPCTGTEISDDNTTIYHTAGFDVTRTVSEHSVHIEASGNISFSITESLPCR